MADESIHEKLERVRKPHVHIKYEVYTPNGMVERELPFVVGVMGDFSGNPSTPLPPLRTREFTMIDRDNFNQIMDKMNVELNIRVKNTLANDGSEIPLTLKFKSMEDFDPVRVAEQFPQLKELLEARERLQAVLTAGERSPELEALMSKFLDEAAKVKKLAAKDDSKSPSGDKK
jgi:type VI secretion system protein ImpB